MSKKKLFVLLPRFPYPLDKGDKLRAYHQIKHLSEEFDITLFALSHDRVDDTDIEKLKPFCIEIHIAILSRYKSYWSVVKSIFKNTPFQVAYFYDSRIYKRIKQIIDKGNYDHIYCQLIRTAEYVKDSDIKKTIDFQDAFSKNALRRANSSNNILERLFFKEEAKRVSKYESLICKIFDNKTIITEEDKTLVEGDSNDILVVRNGVDHNYFAPQDTIKKYDVVFTGNMGYHPNVDAGLFLASEIMAIVRKSKPNTTLVLAGTSPASAIKNCQSNLTHITGWIDDIRTAYSEARIFVAPLRMGSGLQNKLLEAMSMGMPCITSELANQALNAKENKDIVVAKTAQEFADQIITLIDNPNYASEIAQNGRDFIRNNYDWYIETMKLSKIMQ